MPDDDIAAESMAIENRSDFAQWAIERSRAFVAGGGNRVLSARDVR